MYFGFWERSSDCCRGFPQLSSKQFFIAIKKVVNFDMTEMTYQMGISWLTLTVTSNDKFSKFAGGRLWTNHYYRKFRRLVILQFSSQNVKEAVVKDAQRIAQVTLRCRNRHPIIRIHGSTHTRLQGLQNPRSECISQKSLSDFVEHYKYLSDCNWYSG